jgi:hypothetical protein
MDDSGYSDLYPVELWFARSIKLFKLNGLKSSEQKSSLFKSKNFELESIVKNL